jgi:DNA-binding response OmpR family regulator
MSVDSKILVIEDEQDIQELIEYNLLKQGFKVELSSDGEDGLSKAGEVEPNLIILDIMLPKLDGLSVCKEIRKNPKLDSVPIIMLTAKSEETDIVVGLELGADDYMTKPFSPNELVARVRAHLRRNSRKSGNSETTQKNNDLIEHGQIVIDILKHVVKIDGEIVQFTLAEFKLLKALIEDAGRVYTRDQLISVIAGEDTYLVGRNIDVHIRSIRKKLGDLADIIETIRGVGYKCKG